MTKPFRVMQQREETCKRRDLGFVIFVCVYASVVFTFSCMKNMEVLWWWHDSRIALTVKEKIVVARDLWL